MAAVPELNNEVMAYYSDNENDLFFEVDGPQQTKCSFQDLALSSLGNESIQLKVSHQLCNMRFRQGVSVIVAAEKLKKIPSVCSENFLENDLRSLFFFIFAEEPIDCSWEDNCVSDAALLSHKCRLWDRNQKPVVLCGPHELQALHLNKQDMNRQVVFSMRLVPGEEIHKIPVTLGIKEKNLYLSCVMKDKPTLYLETVEPEDKLKMKEKRFIFNKIENRSKVEFESALYPNWYISTSQAEQTPVFLGNSRGGQDITDFTLEYLSH
ncbi:interleukin-1 beta [Rhynchonycteris naso]